MKYIRTLNTWEKQLFKQLLSGGTYIHNAENFKGMGLYKVGEIYYYAQAWNAYGVRLLYKGVNSK
jgi:hypothetical protein